MKIMQSTIERLLYMLLLLVFISLGLIYVKISKDDTRKFEVLKANQDQLICIVKGFSDPVNFASHGEFIDKCVKDNPLPK